MHSADKEKTMKVGYIRVSSAATQHIERQEVLMQELGVEKIFIDRVSGKSLKDREELANLLAFVRIGDTVIVESISRLARNTRDLLSIVEVLDSKGVEFVSKKEAIDTKTTSGRFMLTVFAAIAELEREYILQRQKEGIAIAKMNGKYKGRKPVAVDMSQFETVYRKWKSGQCTAVNCMTELGLKPSTFYRRVKEFEGR